MPPRSPRGDLDPPVATSLLPPATTHVPSLAMQSMFTTVLLCAFNLSVVVMVVAMNKYMFSDAVGFKFGTVLTGLHTAATALGLSAWVRIRGLPLRPLPWRQQLVIGILAGATVNASTFSLLYNSVGFYSLCKLLTVPVVALLQFALYGHVLPWRVIACLTVSSLGVGWSTVTDVSVTGIGLLCALIQILSSAVFVEYVKYLQVHYKLSPLEVNYYQAPLATVLTAMSVPFLENVTRLAAWPWWQGHHLAALVVSAALGLLVNVSFYACVDRLGAISFQVMGQLKTVLMLFISYFVYGTVLTWEQALPSGVALLGMWGYAYCKVQEQLAGQRGHSTVVGRVKKED